MPAMRLQLSWRRAPGAQPGERAALGWHGLASLWLGAGFVRTFVRRQAVAEHADGHRQSRDHGLASRQGSRQIKLIDATPDRATHRATGVRTQAFRAEIP